MKNFTIAVLVIIILVLTINIINDNKQIESDKNDIRNGKSREKSYRRQYRYLDSLYRNGVPCDQNSFQGDSGEPDEKLTSTGTGNIVTF